MQWLEITTHFFFILPIQCWAAGGLAHCSYSGMNLQKLQINVGFHIHYYRRRKWYKLCTVIKAFMEVICHVFQILLANACHKATSNFRVWEVQRARKKNWKYLENSTNDLSQEIQTHLRSFFQILQIKRSTVIFYRERSYL